MTVVCRTCVIRWPTMAEAVHYHSWQRMWSHVPDLERVGPADAAMRKLPESIAPRLIPKERHDP